MSNLKNIVITRGHQVDFSSLSEQEITDIEERIRDNDFDFSELIQRLGYDVEVHCITHYEAFIDGA